MTPLDFRPFFAAAILCGLIWWLSAVWPAAAGAMLGGAVLVVLVRGKL